MNSAEHQLLEAFLDVNCFQGLCKACILEFHIWHLGSLSGHFTQDHIKRICEERAYHVCKDDHKHAILHRVLVFVAMKFVEHITELIVRLQRLTPHLINCSSLSHEVGDLGYGVLAVWLVFNLGRRILKSQQDTSKAHISEH